METYDDMCCLSEEDDKLFRQATIYRDDEQFEDSLDILELLNRKYKKNYPVLLVLAHIYWITGDLSSAIERFKLATRLRPKSKPASLGLFHCLWEKGMKDEAFLEMKRFMAISNADEYIEIVNEINNS